MKTLILFCMLRTALTYTLTQETSLHTTLLSGYDRSIRPGADRSQPLNIKFSFYFVSVKEFDENSSKFAITGAFGVVWNDNRLAWNPLSYGNDLGATTLLQSQIWVPYIVNIKSFGTLKKLGDSDLSCLVYYTGDVIWVPPDVFESTCDADVTYYPFDSQKCNLRFYSPGFYPDSVKLVPETDQLDMKIYETNGLWEITGTRIYTIINEYSFEELRLEISMKRRTIYYIAGLILPICLMSFLQVTSFLLPVESGERVGFSITVLLAVAVFLTIIQDKLPEASEPNVSFLTYKLLCDLVLGCLMIIAAVLGLNFYHKDKRKPVPKGFKCLLIVACKRTCCKRNRNVITIVKEKDFEQNQMCETNYDTTWEEVGLAFDRICVIVFTAALLINNIVYLVVMAAQ